MNGDQNIRIEIENNPFEKEERILGKNLFRACGIFLPPIQQIFFFLRRIFKKSIYGHNYSQYFDYFAKLVLSKRINNFQRSWNFYVKYKKINNHVISLLKKNWVKEQFYFFVSERIKKVNTSFSYWMTEFERKGVSNIKKITEHKTTTGTPFCSHVTYFKWRKIVCHELIKKHVEYLKTSLCSVFFDNINYKKRLSKDMKENLLFASNEIVTSFLMNRFQNSLKPSKIKKNFSNYRMNLLKHEQKLKEKLKGISESMFENHLITINEQQSEENVYTRIPVRSKNSCVRRNIEEEVPFIILGYNSSFNKECFLGFLCFGYLAYSSGIVLPIRIDIDVYEKFFRYIEINNHLAGEYLRSLLPFLSSEHIYWYCLEAVDFNLTLFFAHIHFKTQNNVYNVKPYRKMTREIRILKAFLVRDSILQSIEQWDSNFVVKRNFQLIFQLWIPHVITLKYVLEGNNFDVYIHYLYASFLMLLSLPGTNSKYLKCLYMYILNIIDEMQYQDSPFIQVLKRNLRLVHEHSGEYRIKNLKDKYTNVCSEQTLKGAKTHFIVMSKLSKMFDYSQKSESILSDKIIQDFKEKSLSTIAYLRTAPKAYIVTNKKIKWLSAEDTQDIKKVKRIDGNWGINLIKLKKKTKKWISKSKHEAKIDVNNLKSKNLLDPHNLSIFSHIPFQK